MYLLGRRAICAHGRIEYRYRGAWLFEKGGLAVYYGNTKSRANSFSAFQRRTCSGR